MRRRWSTASLEVAYKVFYEMYEMFLVKNEWKALKKRELVLIHYSLLTGATSRASSFALRIVKWSAYIHIWQILSLFGFSPSTMSSRHSASPVVFTSARSSPKEELHPATSPQLAPSFSSSSSSSSGPRTFYPRQGATSKYLIGWKKPEGTINSVGFMDSRK